MNLGAISAQFGADVSGFMNGVAQVMAGAQAAAASMSQMGNASANLTVSTNNINNVGNAASSAATKVTGLHGIWSRFTGLLGGITSGIVSVAQSIVGGVVGFVTFSAHLAEAIHGYFSLITGGSQFVQSLVVQNAAMEQTTTVFTGLLHSASGAKDMLKQLSDFAEHTPFEFPQIDQDAQKLLSMGAKARSIIPDLQAIGDAASGTGKGSVGLDIITKGLGAMYIAGEVTTKGMTLLTRQGIPGWQMLADAMGLSVKQVEDLSKKNKLGVESIDLLVASMERMYGGSMKAQTMTFNGMVTLLQDNISHMWMDFTGPLFEHAKQSLFLISELLSSPVVKNFAHDMGILLGDALGTFTNIVTTQVIPGVEHFYTLWRNIDTALHSGGMQSAEDAFHRLGDMIEQHVNPIVQKLQSWFASLFTDQALITDADALSTAFGYIGIALGIIGGIILPIVDQFVRLAQALTDGGVQGEITRTALIGLAAAFEAFKIGQLVMALPALIVGLWGTATAAWGAATAFIALNMPLILISLAIGIAVMLIILAIQHWGQIIGWLQGVWTSFSGYFIGVWKQIQSEFKSGVDSVSAWWTNLWSTVSGFFSGVWTDITSTLSTGWAKVQHDMQWLWDTVTGALHTAWNDILNFLIGVVSNIVTYFHDRWTEIAIGFQLIWNSGIVLFLRGVVTTIYNIITKLGSDTIQGWIIIWNTVRDFAVTIWTDIYTAISSKFQQVYDFVARIALQLLGYIHDRWQEIQDGASVAWQIIYDNVIKPLTNMYNDAMKILDDIKQYFSDRWNDISRNTSSTYQSVSNTMDDKMAGIRSKVHEGTTDIGNQFATSWAKVQHDTEWAWNAISSIVVTQFNKVLGFITDTAPKIRDWFLKGFAWARDGVGTIIEGLGNNAIDMLNSFLGGLEGFLNMFGDALNGVAKAVGAAGVVPHIGIGRVAHFAQGVQNFGGGPAIVGEEGPELMIVPQGASILPHKQTMNLLQGGKLGKLFPGFADGTGSPLTDLMNWMGKGASNVLSNVFHGTLDGVGAMAPIATGVVTMVGKWGTDMISKLLSSVTSAVTGGVGGSAGGSFGAGGTYPGGVMSWIMQAIGLTGAPGNWANALATIAMNESGGNPGAANGWDINAINGTPSIGLMQTILPTFLANMVSGHGNIYNPVDNAAAAINYIIGRYGSVFNVPGIVSMSQGGPYIGYGNGGTITEPIMGRGMNTGSNYLFGENGPEYVSPNGGKGVTIILQVDGRTMASALAPHMAQEIRIRTGMRS